MEKFQKVHAFTQYLKVTTRHNFIKLLTTVVLTTRLHKAPRPASDLHTELPGYLGPGGSIAHKEEDRQEEVKLPQNSRDRTASVNSNGSTTDDSSEN